MSNNYQIYNTSIDVLVEQSKVYGFSDTVYLINYQLEIIREKNREIRNFIKIKKLFNIISLSSKMDKKELYETLLKDLKKIELSKLEEYRALVVFLEKLIETP